MNSIRYTPGQTSESLSKSGQLLRIQTCQLSYRGKKAFPGLLRTLGLRTCMLNPICGYNFGREDC